MGKFLGRRETLPGETFLGGGSGILAPFKPSQTAATSAPSTTPSSEPLPDPMQPAIDWMREANIEHANRIRRELGLPPVE